MQHEMTYGIYPIYCLYVYTIPMGAHIPTPQHSQTYGPGAKLEVELELIQTQMTQKPMLRAEVGMRVRCTNKASA